MKTPPSISSERTGRYVLHRTGYYSFHPTSLAPPPEIEYDGELRTLLSNADRDLARLDAIAHLLPNPDPFVAMYVRHEAVLSSQIEGTQSTLEDMLAYEVQAQAADESKDVSEIVNYVRAMNHGLMRLGDLPLSLRLIREIHGELMEGVRGGDRSPGEFRTSQNWIGAAGCNLGTASFVPPPPDQLVQCLGDFERFLHEAKANVPLLIRCGIAHAQFETIHPFQDGNGRVGRLLMTLMLCEDKGLSRPLLYLSVYLKAHRLEYYDRLTAVRHRGHWEAWLKFFLIGVSRTARAATDTAGEIVRLRDGHRAAVYGDEKALRLLDELYKQPVVSVGSVGKALAISFPTASRLVGAFEEREWLREMTGFGRNRLFRYEPYMSLFRREAFERDFS